MARQRQGAALAIVAIAVLGCVHAEPVKEIVLRSEVQFQPLNPARGDASPGAGVLWGDLKKDVPTGALISFAGGFSSPPHIHNISYRAIVISGAVHNDDPNAERMWMAPGSFWTQPAGESHVTAAADGSKALAFLETVAGPYLVQPPDAAFDNGERPVNVEAGNVVWLDSADITWIDARGATAAAKGVKLAFLWGDPQDGQPNGTLLKLRAGFSGELSNNGAWLRAVMIRGQARHRWPGDSDVKLLAPGSYFGSHGEVAHKVTCGAPEDCLIYVSAEGRYEFTQP